MNDYFDPNAVHDAQRLKELQALPLERKIMITQARIMEFVQAMGGVENVVVSYSGGKDSTVLLHICKQLYPDIKCVYSDTGLEYPEVRAMAKANGADIVRPKMRFDEVITKYGYPLISKEVSEAIYYARRIRNAPKESDEADAHGDGRLNCDLKPYGVEGGRLSEDEVTSTERDLTHTSVGGIAFRKMMRGVYEMNERAESGGQNRTEECTVGHNGTTGKDRKHLDYTE